MRVQKIVAAAMAALALVACSTTTSPAPPRGTPTTVAPTTAAATTPDEPTITLPADQTVLAPGAHVAPNEWGFITLPQDTTVAIRFNGLWQGAEGSMAERRISQAPDGPKIDLSKAVPHFLSYSYVLVTGDAQAAPILDVLPTLEGNLYEVTSALIGGRACPDYPGPTKRGLGHEVRVCLVTLSDDGGRPTALVGAVPGNSDGFWFFDAPEATPLPG